MSYTKRAGTYLAGRAGRMATNYAVNRIKRWWKGGPRRTKSRRRAPIPQGFPKRQMVKLKYTETINIDPASAVLGSHVFCANGLFDPNVTGTGHQPLYFDQYMVAYDHYTVLGSKIKVTPCNASTSAIIPGAYGIILSDDATVNYTTVDSVVESNQGRRFKLYGTDNIPQTAYSKNITKKFSARRFFGKKFVGGASDLKGTTAANPSERANFIVWAGSLTSTSGGGASDAGNIMLLVEIEYIALLSEPKFVAQSS